MSATDDIIRKVQALINKADRSDNEHESEAFYAKARELILKHTIDESQLSVEERAAFIKKTVSLSPKIADQYLLNVISNRNSVKFVKHAGRIKGATDKQRYGWLFGTEADIAYVEALFASLILHRERELGKADKPAWEHGKQFNAAFRLSYAIRIAARLDEWASKAKEAAGPGTELVLFDKSAAIDKFLEGQIGKVDAGAKIKAVNSYGHGAGQRAANKADVSGGRRNLGNHHRALA